MNPLFKLWYCRTFGHRRHYTAVRRMRLTRGGYFAMRDCTRVHCERCGIGGDGCYEESTWERVRYAVRRWFDSVEACKHSPPSQHFDPNELPF